jgi:hypothetical protein
MTPDGYFKWACVVRLYHGVELMTAKFVFEHQAIAFARSLPESSKPFLRWIGHGLPPDEPGVTDSPTYL